MPNVRPQSDLRRLTVVGSLIWLVTALWAPSPAHLFVGAAPQAKKATASTPAAKLPHERVEEIAQTLELEQMRPQKSAPKSYALSESEINAYIVYKMKEQPVKGMKSLVVNLRDANQLTAVALVDFEEVKMGNEGLMAAAFKKLLGGDRYLKMDGTIDSGQHKGRLTVHRAELGGVTIPNSLVQAIIKRVGEKQHPPVDLTQPFELPLGLERVEISKGALRVKT